jgi:hypothetical protein
VAWTAGNPIPNPVLNSAMQIWQRGSSVAVTASSIVYTADRWQIATGVNQAFTVSQQATGNTTNLPNIQYCARFQRNSGQTGTTIVYQGQAFETVNSIPFVGKTVTLSFYARSGANFTAASNNLGVILQTGTGTDQNLFGFTATAYPINSAATLTTTWQRFTYTVALSSSITQIAPIFSYTPVGTAGTNDYFDVTGVQIDVGPVALPFRTNAPTLQGELAACQRYYILIARGLNSVIGLGFHYTATNVTSYITLPVDMRTAPTLDAFSGTNVFGFLRNGASTIFNSFTIDQANSRGVSIYNNTQASGIAGQAGYLFNATSSSYVAFSAEL